MYSPKKIASKYINLELKWETIKFAIIFEASNTLLSASHETGR